MITEIEDFFTKGCGRCDRYATPDCSTRAWIAGLEALRRICRDAGLAETVKWGHPCYMHAGRNIAIMGAFRGDFRLTFFNAALLSDPEGLLEKQGPNTRHPDCIRFTDTGRPADLAPAIAALIAEAKAHAEAGRLPPKEIDELVLPDDLRDALDADPELAECFAALTPGRQKSWALHVGDAKTVATRLTRIERGRAKILAGKGALER